MLHAELSKIFDNILHDVVDTDVQRCAMFGEYHASSEFVFEPGKHTWLGILAGQTRWETRKRDMYSFHRVSDLGRKEWPGFELTGIRCHGAGWVMSRRKNVP